MTTMKLFRFLTLAGISALAWFFFSRLLGTSQSGVTSSISSNVRHTIRKRLTGSGYTSKQAYFWFLVSNMETAGFTSNLFKTANNLFGMKQPSLRPTTSEGPTSGFATFASVELAAADLVLYLQEFNYPSNFMTLSDQLVFMKSKGYFGDETLDSYRGKVVAWANKFGYPLDAS